MRSLTIAFLACAFASSALGADLKLRDGRVLEGYRILSHDRDSVTIRHTKGAVKVDKALIDSAVLSEHGIAGGHDGFTDEQRAAIVESTLKITETAELTVLGVTLELWLRFREDGRLTAIVVRDRKRTGSEALRQNYDLVSVPAKDLPELLGMLNRALDWIVKSDEMKIPAVRRSLGKIGGFEWWFEYGTKRDASISTVGLTLWTREEIQGLKALIEKFPEMSDAFFAKVELAKQAALLP